MYLITREQLRTVIAAGLHASPDLPTDIRQALTEFGGNADRVGFNYMHRDPGGPCCPLASVTDRWKDDYLPGEGEFVAAVDDAIGRLGLPRGDERATALVI